MHLLGFVLSVVAGCGFFGYEVVTCWETVKGSYPAIKPGGSCGFAVWHCYGINFGTLEECCDATFPEIKPPKGWSKETDPLCNPQDACAEAFLACMNEVEGTKAEYNTCLMTEPQDKEKCKLLKIVMQSMIDVCVGTHELCDPDTYEPETPTTGDTDGPSTWDDPTESSSTTEGTSTSGNLDPTSGTQDTDAPTTHPGTTETSDTGETVGEEMPFFITYTGPGSQRYPVNAANVTFTTATLAGTSPTHRLEEIIIYARNGNCMEQQGEEITPIKSVQLLYADPQGVLMVSPTIDLVNGEAIFKVDAYLEDMSKMDLRIRGNASGISGAGCVGFRSDLNELIMAGEPTLHMFN